MVIGFAVASGGASAASLPPSTWVALTTVPGAGQSPVFALAVNPVNDQDVIAGNASGGLYRSVNAGSTWTSVHSGKAGILTIAFSPFNPATLLAGTNGGGMLLSTDGGSKWRAAQGMDGRDVRTFGFARSQVLAGTDKGVYTSDDGASWTQSGLPTVSIDALAVAAVNPPVRVFAGGETAAGGGALLYQSADGGTTWSVMNPAISGTIVTRLTAGPLPPGSDLRPLVLGTNTGLFYSKDNGVTFTALSGGALLPSTDYTQAVFAATHFDRFFVASDGGGGSSGGLWSTADSGRHFSDLQPPLASVTSIAVSNDELPIVYVATFRPGDHTPAMWAFRDTGGTPQGPAFTSTPHATASRTGTQSNAVLDLLQALASSQVPYVAVGVIALLLIGLAVWSHFRSRRR